MTTHLPRRRPARFLALVLAFLVTLVLPLPALADNTTPNGATPLTAASPSVSGTLVGSTGGQFQYYQLAYPGDSTPVLFTLIYQPSFGNGNQDFGFNLYGPNNLTFAGQVTNTNGNIATAQYTLVYPSPMDVLVQVYNYTNGGSVSYSLSVTGLSGSAGTVVGSSANTTPGGAIPVPATSAAIGGSIVGSAAGAFQYYTLPYPGGYSTLSVTMNATPLYSGSGQAAGFNLWRPTPSGSVLVASSSLNQQNPSTNSAIFTASVSGVSAGNYQLQVYNYWPNVTVNYGITVNGLAGPAPAASGNLDAGHAILLHRSQPGATETLTGDRGGAFNYFLVPYGGGNANLILVLTYQSTGSAPAGQLGFKVYSGANLVATLNPNDDGNGVYTAMWTYQNPTGQTFGIQVFNYAANTTASYEIYAQGEAY